MLIAEGGRARDRMGLDASPPDASQGALLANVCERVGVHCAGPAGIIAWSSTGDLHKLCITRYA